MKSILYITYDKENAASINTHNRAAALEALGFSVTIFVSNKNRLWELWLMMWKFSYTMVYIRIDGSCRLDLFTLLKIFHFYAPVVWEIHGFYEENIPERYSRKRYVSSIIKNLKRKTLSSLVDGYVFVSEELMAYAQTKLVHHTQTVIPNFQCSSQSVNKNVPYQGIRGLLRKGTYVVLWAGNGRYHWHALDVIEKIARKIFTSDKHIYFILISNHLWHSFTWRKNIIIMKSLPHEVLGSYIRDSNLCLALYHKPKWCPFYFSPLKIIDYMMAKKPIIASAYGQIKSMIINGKNGFITNEIEYMVQKILFLKKNKKIGDTVGNSGYRYVTGKRNLETATHLYRNFFISIKAIKRTQKPTKI